MSASEYLQVKNGSRGEEWQALLSEHLSTSSSSGGSLRGHHVHRYIGLDSASLPTVPHLPPCSGEGILFSTPWDGGGIQRVPAPEHCGR